MRSNDRRLDRLEEKLKTARATPWWQREDIKAAVADIMTSPTEPCDASAWEPESLTACKQAFVAAFGRPSWLDGAWRWPQHRSGSDERFGVISTPGNGGQPRRVDLIWAGKWLNVT